MANHNHNFNHFTGKKKLPKKNSTVKKIFMKGAWFYQQRKLFRSVGNGVSDFPLFHC